MKEYDLKKIQNIEFEILEEFDRICKKHKIDYFLDSGTALGAVRHGGFIPWDDDIDVGMIREDYNKFLKIAPMELDKRFFLQTIETDPMCPCLFAKIRKNGTVYQENNKTGMKMHMGIWIDIFPFDYISDFDAEQRRCITRAKAYKNMFMLKKIPHIYARSEKTSFFYARAIVRKLAHLALQTVPDSFFINGIQKIIDSGKTQKEFVTCYYYGTPKVWKTKGIVPVGKTMFKGKIFSSVHDPDYYLRVQYGDYMKLPPIEKRIGHRPLYVDYGEL